MKPTLIWDCSVTVANTFEDERDEYSLRTLRTVRRSGALVPSIWPLEVVNALRFAERKNRIKPSVSRRFLAFLGRLPIQIEDVPVASKDMVALYESAEKYSLTSYDASYLRLALMTRLPLAAKDGDLVAAAKKAGVKLFT